MKKFLLKLLMGASLTASVFVFQACYGCPPDELYDIPRNKTQVNMTEEVQDVQEPVVEDEESEDVNPELL